jgi:hypothetical protein
MLVAIKIKFFYFFNFKEASPFMLSLLKIGFPGQEQG